ncbi:MAG: hypothetical protein ACE368_00800 [Paracoccaceae bacterium]
MRDGLAAGLFTGGTRRVHVNPVVIPGKVGESVDPCLGDLIPVRRAKRPARVLCQFHRGLDDHHRWFPSDARPAGNQRMNKS